MSQKTVQNCFCQNFVKFPPILIIFGRKMAKRLKLCEMHIFSTPPISCQHTTVLNTRCSLSLSFSRRPLACYSHKTPLRICMPSMAHYSFNQEQSRRLENIQKRAVNIIYGHGNYVASCSDYRISPRVDRRKQLCIKFF